MKNNKFSRIFYIILVPIILIVILLNSGFLQARVPAITISGAHYNVAQFNYYYFSAYNDFMAENFDENGENGPFDPTVALRSQNKDEDTTWKDYFTSLAEQRMIEVTYYNSQAAVAGYEFSEEELNPIQKQLDFIEADRLENNITLKNYLVAYWGVGMTEEIYTAELTRDVQADAYKAYLTSTAEVSDADIDGWIAAHNPESYPTANLCMIELDAAPDRFTGEIGPQQLADLSEKLDRLTARYEAEPGALAELAASFNDSEALAKTEGALTNGTKDTLPTIVADWVFSGSVQPGAYTSLLDEESGKAYLVTLTGWGDDAARQTAIQSLRQSQVDEALEEVRTNSSISYRSLGARLIGR